MEQKQMIDKIYEVIKSSIWDISCGEMLLIWDVLDFIDKNNLEEVDFCWVRKIKLNYINDLWNEKRKSIESQSDETISFIFNLINKD